MPKSSTALRPLPEAQPTPANASERLSPVEEVKEAEQGLQKALESGSSEKVVNLFRGKAKEEQKALERLGMLEADEAQAAPEVAAKLEQTTADTSHKVEAATQKAVEQVQALLGTSEVTTPAPEAVEPEAAHVETIQSAPEKPVAAEESIDEPKEATETVPMPEETKELTPEQQEADEEREAAAETVKENYEAITSFAKEHSLTIDEKTLQISEKEFSKLTKPERMYVEVLFGNHALGNALMRHAEKRLEAMEYPEGDPKRAALMQEAEEIAEEAAVKETAARVMQQNYMNLPEIAALSTEEAAETGASLGGGFDQPSPFGPGEPEGPEGPHLTVIEGGLKRGSLDGVGGVPGAGLTRIDSYKSPKAEADKPKPSFIDRFVRKSWKDLTYGKGGDGGTDGRA